MAIKARKPGPAEFAKWDRLPHLLAGAAGDGAKPTTEEVKETAAFLLEVLLYCCVDPRISETAAPDAADEIRPDELPQQDWIFIIAWAMRLKEAEKLRPFRAERKDDGAGGDGQAVFTETVDAARDRGPGAGAGAGPGGSEAAGGAAGAGDGGGRG
jgi:hypothetical protein